MVTDLAVLLWVVFWAWAGRRVFTLVDRLGRPGDSLGDAGRRLSSAGGKAGRAVDDLPVVGDRLAEPFEAVRRGGESLTRAGEGAATAAHDLAVVLGLVVALLPILWVLVRFLPGRVAWVRDAGAARALRAEPGGAELFALRALAHRPVHELRRAVGDPMAAYRSGDPAAITTLAALEYKRLGLGSVPTTPPLHR